MEATKIHEMLRRLHVCDMVRGNETTAELLRLLTTPQGLEFFQKTGFPTLEVARAFCGADAEAAGVWIDAGQITLHNPRRVVLLGNTRARLIYDDLADEKHNVTVMHGGSAHIDASSWAVVFAQNLGGVIEVDKQDNALVDVRN